MPDSDLLLLLYRAARERLPGDFEQEAIRLLKPSLGFDSAIWGVGTLRENGGVTPHFAHLHEQPAEALREWADLNVADPVAKAIMQCPGDPLLFHAPTLFAGKAATAMRSYAKRWGRQSYMVCGIQSAARSSLMAWLSLYRQSPDAHFREVDRTACRGLMAHLREAQLINQQLQLGRLQEGQNAGSSTPATLAIADLTGCLHTPSLEVLSMFRREWLACQPGFVPSPLLEHFKKEPSCPYVGRTLTARCSQVGNLLFLRVRSCRSIEALSARERQVAMAISRGLSSKEVARELGLSPETIRVHTRNTYRKMGVHSQAELASQFSDLRRG